MLMWSKSKDFRDSHHVIIVFISVYEQRICRDMEKSCRFLKKCF